MTTRIGGIVVDIDARLAKLEQELKRGNRELDRFGRDAAASGGRVEAGLAGIGKGVGTLVGVLGGLGIALGASELIGFGREALEMADDLSTAADQVGIGVERFQTLRQVFRELEVDGESFDKAMARLSTTLGDVQSGASDGATKALDKMGITTRILSGEIDTTDELLDAIADSAKRFGTEAEFTSAVVDIFGRKGGVALAAALRDGSGAIREMEADVRSLGTVLTEEQINKLADANESIDRFTEAGKYQFAIFAADAIGYIESVGASLQWWEQRIDGAIVMMARLAGFEGPAGAIKRLNAEAVRDNRNPTDASDVASRLGFSPGAVEFDKPRVPVVRRSGSGGAPRRSGGGGGAGRAARTEADGFARTMAELARRTADARMEFTALNEQWDDVTIIDARMRAEALRVEQEQGVKWTDLQRSQYRAASEDMRSLAVQTKLAEINQRAFNDSLATSDLSEFSSLPQLEADLERIAARLPDLRSGWEIVLAGLDDAQGAAFDGLTRNLEGALLGFQSLEDAAESFGKQVLSMALQAFVFAPLGKALKIPGYAGGTDFAPGGLALVGEEGPELVNLPRGAQVIPNDRLMNISNARVANVGMAGGAPVINQTIAFSGAIDLATRAEVYRLADLTKKSTMAAVAEGRRRSGR